jgi:hypothetical protein
MMFELLVIGLLTYGLVVLGIAATGGRAHSRIAIPDHADAPIVVTRRSSHAATVTTRSGVSRTSAT